MPATDPTLTTLTRACDALAAEWEHDARARRKLTPRDPVADTLDFCASALRGAITRASAADSELSVAEWAALHGRPEPTVRRWCATGAVRARRSGRAWLIPRGALPPAFGPTGQPLDAAVATDSSREAA